MSFNYSNPKKASSLSQNKIQNLTMACNTHMTQPLPTTCLISYCSSSCSFYSSWASQSPWAFLKLSLSFPTDSLCFFCFLCLDCIVMDIIRGHTSLPLGLHSSITSSEVFSLANLFEIGPAAPSLCLLTFSQISS